MHDRDGILEPLQMEVCPPKHQEGVFERQRAQAQRAPFQPQSIDEVAVVDSSHRQHMVGVGITWTHRDGAPSFVNRNFEAVLQHRYICQQGMSRSALGIDGKRLSRQRPGIRQRFGAIIAPLKTRLVRVSKAQGHMCGCKPSSDADGSLKFLPCPTHRTATKGQIRIPPAHKVPICVKRYGFAAPSPNLLAMCELDLERSHDLLRNLVLYAKDIASVSIVAIGPDVGTARCIDKLGADTNMTADDPYDAFEYVCDP